MAALPGGAHAAGAADPMQVDQPRPAAAAAATAPADAKVSDSPPPRAGWFRRPGAVPPGAVGSLGARVSFSPLLLSGGSRVRSARRSAPRAARAAVAASPHRSRAIPLAIREVERSVACQGGHALPSFRLVFACALCKLLDACFPRPVGLACRLGASLQVFLPVLL